MIKKMKLKFILLCMSALLILLTIIITGMNIMNYNSVVRDADDVLSILSQNKGKFPESLEWDMMITDPDPMEDYEETESSETLSNAALADSPETKNTKKDILEGFQKDKNFHGMSAELPYESRYFSILFDSTGTIIQTDLSRIATVNADTAALYAIQVLKSGRERGFLENFRYVCSYEADSIRITFLDCGRKLNAFQDFLYSSIAMAVIGFIVVFFIISFLSGKIIRPIAESYEKQKRFISDAGHEIKTPLTIINANVDVLEMEIGENECLDDIHQQTKRLTSLTNSLVSLARMEEAESTLKVIDFPVSEAVSDVTSSFKIIAQAEDIHFTCDIQPMLTMCGNDEAIRQLVSLLMDNALKYCPSGGIVSAKLFRQGKNIHFTVFNTTATEITKENISHVFERFYRTDASRNSETGGHGIGLSIAKAIVTAHNGKIQASTPDGMSFQISVVFPL